MLQLILFGFIIPFSFQKRQCPLVTCSKELTNTTCQSYGLSNSNQVEVLVNKCDQDQVCDLKKVKNLKKGFYYEDQQVQDLLNFNQEGFCTDYPSLNKELKNGMPCQFDFQCLSLKCDEYMCKGGYAGDPCLSTSDCSSNYYCSSLSSKSLQWKICVPAKQNGESCQYDYECLNESVCSRRTSKEAFTCIQRWSERLETPSLDPRLCLTGTLSQNGYCSQIISAYQTEQNSQNCSIEVLNGYCYSLMSDGTVRSDLVLCQCSLFTQSESKCQWNGVQNSIDLYSLATKLYQQSPYCDRSFLPDNPLDVDFYMVRQCTLLDLDDFETFVSLAHDMLYYSPKQVGLKEQDCLNTFAKSSQIQVPRGNQSLPIEYIFNSSFWYQVCTFLLISTLLFPLI